MEGKLCLFRKNKYRTQVTRDCRDAYQTGNVANRSETRLFVSRNGEHFGAKHGTAWDKARRANSSLLSRLLKIKASRDPEGGASAPADFATMNPLGVFLLLSAVLWSATLFPLLEGTLPLSVEPSHQSPSGSAGQGFLPGHSLSVNNSPGGSAGQGILPGHSLSVKNSLSGSAEQDRWPQLRPCEVCEESSQISMSGNSELDWSFAAVLNHVVASLRLIKSVRRVTHSQASDSLQVRVFDMDKNECEKGGAPDPPKEADSATPNWG